MLPLIAAVFVRNNKKEEIKAGKIFDVLSTIKLPHALLRYNTILIKSFSIRGGQIYHAVKL